MLETEIKKLTKAVEANTAALLGQGVAVDVPTTAAPVPDPVAQASAAETPPANAQEPAAAPSDFDGDYKKLANKFIDVGRAKGTEPCRALLAEYSIGKLSDLPEDKWAEVWGKLTALLA
jgi:hypothetical protein